MPLFAGFDIGILNLAFCIIDSEKWRTYEKGESNDPGIICWENLNILGDPEKCCEIIKSGKKRGQACESTCKWVGVNEQGHTEYYCGKHKPTECEKYKKPNTKNTNMSKLKQAAFNKLDQYDIFNDVTSIVIESQPRVNQQMKMFGASIEAYFIIRQYIDNGESKLRSIKPSPAKNKLRLYDGPEIRCNHIKNPYDRRKYLAQQHVEYFLQRAPDDLARWWTPQGKKDDLADAFLHCLCEIRKCKK